MKTLTAGYERWRCSESPLNTTYCSVGSRDSYGLLIEQSNGTAKVLRGSRSLTFQPRSKIVGVSAGKFYCLGWDENGRLYSWGNNSVGLGHEFVSPERRYEHPREIQSLLGEFIVSAHCYLNYSIAMTSEGTFFEWGM